MIHIFIAAAVFAVVAPGKSHRSFTLLLDDNSLIVLAAAISLRSTILRRANPLILGSFPQQCQISAGCTEVVNMFNVGPISCPLSTKSMEFKRLRTWIDLFTCKVHMHDYEWEKSASMF
jgi:hypothetical protein